MAQSVSRPISGPAWDNACEYPSLESAEFQADMRRVDAFMQKISDLQSGLGSLTRRVLDEEDLSADERNRLIGTLQEIAALKTEANEAFANLITYTNCEICLDASNSEAQKVYSVLQQKAAQSEEIIKPSQLFLTRAPDDLIALYLDHPATRPSEFQLLQERRLKDTLLSEQEETLLTSLRVNGHLAWGTLYNNISGKLRCTLEGPGLDGKSETKTVGLAQASGLLRSSDPLARKGAWQAIHTAWRTQEDSCAGILNSLAGWRLELVKRRSTQMPIDFLTAPLHSNRIQRETLDAMLTAIQEEIEWPRRAMSLMARGLGQDKITPWDLLAPAPARFTEGASEMDFETGFNVVAEAFDSVHPEIGAFARKMRDEKWIEGRVMPQKRQGAFCTRFAKSRTPRVFQTYMGSIYDIKTLAHEMGHAYHGWVLRDLPAVQHRYPMTLAETASVFAETALSDHLMTTSRDTGSRYAVAWQEAANATSFLLNIPARFEFEKSFYEMRGQQTLNPDDFRRLTEQAWRKWYGETLTQVDDMFWASKLHFHMAGTSFYNFPYAFGYLFSLGIYARRQELGNRFLESYVDLLRDTGRMTAEDLVQKHLDEDIRQTGFWKKSLAIVKGKIQEFETLTDEVLR